MIPLTLSEIAEIVGGHLNTHADPQATVTGSVEFDSRKLTEGSLFVAIPGERVDGHEFAEASIAAGAVAVLAAKEVSVPAVMVHKASGHKSNAYALAHDHDGSAAAVIQAMSALAREVVLRTGVEVVGVTGSAGKTSTKDMLASVLRSDGETVAPPGSFNNEIGHPYTALRVNEHTKYLVAELSARGVGHVAHLARIAPPTVGVVLNVGSAHLGEFGSREIIAQAKGELAEALPATGTAVLNADDPYVLAMRDRTDANVLLFSVQSDSSESGANGAAAPAVSAGVRAAYVRMDNNACAKFMLHFPDGSAEPVRLQVAGLHQVSNALAAAAAGWACGLEPAQIAQALSSHEAASAHRMAVREVGGLKLIDDAYNANPESMRAGLEAASAAADTGRVVAVLGPMGELGDDADQQHFDVGLSLAGIGVEVLIAVGAPAIAEGARQANAESSSSSGHQAGARGTIEVIEVPAESSGELSVNQQAAQIVRSLVQPGDVVFAKASNAAKLWEVTDLLATDLDEGEK